MPLSETCAETQEPDGVSLTRARVVKREGRRARGMCADPSGVPPALMLAVCFDCSHARSIQSRPRSCVCTKASSHFIICII